MSQQPSDPPIPNPIAAPPSSTMDRRNSAPSGHSDNDPDRNKQAGCGSSSTTSTVQPPAPTRPESISTTSSATLPIGKMAASPDNSHSGSSTITEEIGSAAGGLRAKSSMAGTQRVASPLASMTDTQRRNTTAPLNKQPSVGGRRRREGIVMAQPLTLAQRDMRAANATLRGKKGLEDIKPYEKCTFEEQLVHPTLLHIPLRSRMHRGPNRAKVEIRHLSKSIKSITQNEMTLKTFHASSKELPGHWLSSLGRALPSNTYLRRILFNNNDVEDGDLEALFKGLEDNEAVIEVTVGNSRMTDVGAESAAHMLTENSTVQVLNITGKKPSAFSLTEKVSIPAITALGAGHLSEALEANTTLTSLVVAQHKMWDVGAAVIARALRVNTTLTHLVLSRNKIGDPGAKALALALEKNTALTALDLSANRIGDVGATDLSKGLEANRTLRSLDLSRNDIGNEGVRSLFVLLASHNPYLVGLPLVDNSQADAAHIHTVEELLRHRHTVDIVRHTRLPIRTHHDEFKDSDTRLLFARVYTDKDPAVGYHYPSTKMPLLYPKLPEVAESSGQPPVSLVTLENYKMRQRQERVAIGKTTGFKKWKASALKVRGAVEKREWFPAKEAWAEWKRRLSRRYQDGIDQPPRFSDLPTESPIMALAHAKSKLPKRVRPPGYMTAEEVKAMGKFKYKRKQQQGLMGSHLADMRAEL